MVERLSGGLTPADGSDPRTFPSIWNDFADDFEGKDIPDFDLTSPAFPEALIYDPVSGRWVNDSGNYPVIVFDDASDRSAALPSPVGGMVTFLKDSNVLEAWFGNRWGQVSGAGSITVSDVAPTGPDVEDGALWFNSALGRTFIYYEDVDSFQWVEVGAGSGPTAAAVTPSAPANGQQGQLWFDSESGNLYFYYVDVDGGQWVQVRSAAPAGGGGSVGFEGSFLLGGM